MTTAVAQISAATMLRSTAPIVSARSARRMFGTGDVSSSDTPVRRRELVDRLARPVPCERCATRRIRSRERRTTQVRDQQDDEDAERLRQVVGDLGRAALPVMS